MATVLKGDTHDLVMAAIQDFLPDGPDVDHDRLVMLAIYLGFRLRQAPELRGRPLVDYRQTLGWWRECCYAAGIPRGSINLSQCWRAFSYAFPKCERFGYFDEPPTAAEIFAKRDYRWNLPAQPRQPVRV